MTPEQRRAKQIQNHLFKLADPKHGTGTAAVAQPQPPGGGAAAAATSTEKKPEAQDYHPQSELMNSASFLEGIASHGPDAQEAICNAFRFVVTEQPHKVPLAASLISFLVVSPNQQRRGGGGRGGRGAKASRPGQDDAKDGEAAADAAATNDETAANGAPAGEGTSAAAEAEDSLGIRVVKDLVKAFRTYLDTRLWRNARLSMHMFASLLPARIIDRRSFLALLSSFAAVLDELGVSSERADRAAVVVIEAMCWAGRDMFVDVSTGREDAELRAMAESLVDGVVAYAKEVRSAEEDLISPWPSPATTAASSDKSEAAAAADAAAPDENHLREESFSTHVAALVALRERGFRRPKLLPTPMDLLPPGIVAMIHAEAEVAAAAAAAAAAEEDATSSTPSARVKLPEVLVPPEDEDETFGGSGIATTTAMQLSNDAGLLAGGGAAKKQQPAGGGGGGGATSASSRRRSRRERRNAAAVAALQRLSSKSSDANLLDVGRGEEERWRAGAGPEGSTPRLARWFNETVPTPGTPASVVLRSLLADLVDIYEINRKECARILFDVARWLRRGTFACRSVPAERGMFGGEADDEAGGGAEAADVAEDGSVEGGWVLDDLLVETILSTCLQLPQAPQVALYYLSLLREVVTLSPQTVAPSLGKSVRRFYSGLRSARTEGEVMRRFADWFSVHLSNFNFSWAWKEWIPDAHLPASHPKRAFARRIVELEVRLAYYERVRGTLPEEIRAGALAPEEPTPAFTYATEGHPYRERALGLIQSFRARATPPVIMAELESFRLSILPAGATATAAAADVHDDSLVPMDAEAEAEAESQGKVRDAAQADVVVRDLATQALLSVGSRSFSHFLNVVERYHVLLRQLSSTPAMRVAILGSAARFWSRSAQWTQIVFDKLLQYKIVEPTDVVRFVLQPPRDVPSVVLRGSGDDVGQSQSKLDPPSAGGKAPRDWSTFNWWDTLKLTVQKVNGRVEQVRRRLEVLEREAEEEKEKEEAAKAASDGGGAATASADGTAADASAAAPKLPLFPGTSLPTKPVGAESPAKRPYPDPAAAAAAVAASKRRKVQGTPAEAREALSAIQTEQKKVLVGAVRGLVALLRQADALRDEIIGGSGEEAVASWGDGDWQAWWIRTWYREMLRTFARELSNHRETIKALAFSPSAAAVGDADTLELGGGSASAQGEQALDETGRRALELFERACQFATQ